jgi:phenylacetyl-CoA:acceptor oxidoreductase 27-kDa subunit
MTEPAAATPSARRWGMVIDLNRCVGCQTCVAACKHANDTLPGVQWRQVLDVERGTFPDVQRLFLVVGCQHCDEPPCVPVCPTGATFRRPDGLVAMNEATCIGCGYCAVACPYQARTIAHEMHPYFQGETTAQEKAASHPERLGVAQKCNFCEDKVDDGLARGLVPGVDQAATPACAASCIADAIHFGDLNDRQSNVANMLRTQVNFSMHEELGARPSIRYLYETPAVPGRDAGPADDAIAGGDDPLAGRQQKFWDYRAAMNFTLGGVGSGLAAVTAVLALAVGMSHGAALTLLGLGGACMALGLIFVFFEIGRRARFLHVLARPHTSWMSREVYAVAAFYPLLALDLLFPSLVLHALVGALGATFLFCQVNILGAAKGIPAWRPLVLPRLLLAGGLYEGLGAAAIALALLGPDHEQFPALGRLGAVLALANVLLWRAYLDVLPSSLPARRVVGRLSYVMQTGWLVPAGLLLLVQALPAYRDPLALLAGAGIIVTGAAWKFTLITRAGHFQGFALPKLPQRGSGTRAAPALRPQAR